jgi:hypothetical protein
LEKKYTYNLIIWLCWLVLTPGISSAQLSYNSINMGLGGGGTAYLQGSESLFVNPANLYFQDQESRTHVAFFQSGFHFDTLLPFEKRSDQIRSYRETILVHDNPNQFIRLNQDDRSALVNRNYSNGSDKRNLMSQADLQWLGVSWRGAERAYAIALRTRIGNHYQLGKGIYADTNYVSEEFGFINQSLFQRYQVLHEVSFGYSESFTFLNGQSPGQSEFIVGIASKFVLAGGGFEVGYSNIYSFDESNSLWNRDIEYTQVSSGLFSENDIRNFTNRSPANHHTQDFGKQNLFEPTGYGAGIDLGITYLIHLSPNYSSLQRQPHQPERSLRLSVSITDFGLMRIERDPYQFELSEQQTGITGDRPLSDALFTGAPNEFYHFLTDFGHLPNFELGSEIRESYNQLLPASMQTGFMFHFDWFKVMADASYTMIENAFKPDGLVSYFGTEIRPFTFLPLRAGTRLSKNYAPYYSFGAGFETPFFDINAAILFNSGYKNDSVISSEIIGASVIGFTFHL